jgi:glycosyltransferase involved in cell wall biosynthesis
LSSGKLVPWKQPDLLLRAFASAAPPDAQLVFAGDGEMRHALERWADAHLRGRVTFLGFMNQSEIPVAYRSADLLVLPSSREPWGAVVNEAMNFGIPALVSDQVGCGPDLVTPGQTGDIFAASDQSSLARALRTLLKDTDALTAMGLEARARIGRWGFAEAAAGLADALHALGAE